MALVKPCADPTYPPHTIKCIRFFGVPKGDEGRDHPDTEAPIAPVAIMIHCLGMSGEEYEQLACTNKPKPVLDNHVSLHWVISDSGITNYVDESNIAWGYQSYVSPFAPTTPETPVLGWPDLAAQFPDLSPDFYTIHVGIASIRHASGLDDECDIPCEEMPFNLTPESYGRLIRLLAAIAHRWNISLDSQHFAFHEEVTPVGEDEVLCDCRLDKCVICDTQTYCENCINPGDPSFSENPAESLSWVYGEDESGCKSKVPYEGSATVPTLVMTLNGGTLGVTQSGTSDHTVDITSLSDDANNDLTTGSDGGLFYQAFDFGVVHNPSVVTPQGNGVYDHDNGYGTVVPIDTRDGVSADANNSLSLGSDSLPYYNDVDSNGVSSDANNDLVLGSDSLPYFNHVPSSITPTANGYDHNDGDGTLSAIDIRDGVSGDANNSLGLGSDGRPYYNDIDTNGVSTDVDNDLVLGSDSLPYFNHVPSSIVPTANGYDHNDGEGTVTGIDVRDGVSTDANNDLIVGSDGRPYYNDVDGVSTDANNDLVLGTDGLPFYNDIDGVSADANNDLVLGTDGLPYYNDIDGVSTDVDNDLTIGSDGLPYYNDVDGVSTDANNDLVIGTDGLPYYNDIDGVSADANNDLVIGTDGLPYYNDIDGVSADANNDLVLGTDGLPYYNDVDGVSADANNDLTVGTDSLPYFNHVESSVVDNTNGTYTHNNGSGTSQLVDTRADSNPYDPTGTDLTSTNVGDALDEFANIPEGWRLPGPAGTGPSAAEPTRDDPLNVTDNAQHIGDTLIGGAVGDLPDSKLHVEDGFLTIEHDTFAQFFDFINPTSVVDERRYWLQNRAATPDADSGYLRWVVTNDLGQNIVSGWVPTDRAGNAGTFSGTNTGGKFGARRNLILKDGGPVTQQVVAPTTPWIDGSIHLYPISTAGVGELFVMDGAGNVTQLSSHPEIARELMPPPAWLPNPQYSWSYNVFTRTITGAFQLGSSSEFFEGDIDDGTYTIRDDSGTTLRQGQDDRLKYSERHQPDPEFDSLSTPEERWDWRESRASEDISREREEWDSVAELRGRGYATSTLGPRPKDFSPRPLPPGLASRFN